MRRNIVLIAGIIITFLIVISVFSYEQATAYTLKEIDQGSLALGESGSDTLGTCTWKTYQEGPNNVTVEDCFDLPGINMEIYINIHIQKVDNNTLKLYGTQTFKNPNSNTSNNNNMDTKYVSTNLTAVQYYWKNIRPGISGELASGGSSISRGNISGFGSGSDGLAPARRS